MPWENVKLGELCDVRDGTHDSPKYVEHGYPLLTSKNFSSGEVDFSGAKNISAEDFEKINKRSKVDIGDIVMPMIGTIGSPVVIKKEPNFAIKNVALIKFPSGDVSAEYIQAILSSQFSERNLIGKSRGGTQKFVSLGDIRKLEIPLPPLDEQKRIAAILEKADALRSKRRDALALLDMLTQSIFVEMFGDPVSNPKGWPSRTMDEISDIRLGKMLDKKKMDGLQKFPYLANRNVHWGRFNLANLPTMGLSEHDRKIFSLMNDDLLMCEGGEVGRCAVWKSEDKRRIYFQKAIHRIRPNRKIALSVFLQNMFRQFAKQGGFNKETAVATIAHLPLVKLKKLYVPIPPLEMQEKFVSRFLHLEQRKCDMEKSTGKLDTLFTSLQSRAFNGEL